MKTIKEVSRMLDIPAHTIRYYTDMGLVPNVARSGTNYRLFDDEAIDWLKGTVYFRSLGLSIKDIIRYHDLCFREDDGALFERYALLKEYTGKAKDELEKAKERVAYLERITERDRLIAEKLMDDVKNPVRKKEVSA